MNLTISSTLKEVQKIDVEYEKGAFAERIEKTGAGKVPFGEQGMVKQVGGYCFKNIGCLKRAKPFTKGFGRTNGGISTAD
jgi:hypothetical protein